MRTSFGLCWATAIWLLLGAQAGAETVLSQPASDDVVPPADFPSRAVQLQVQLGLNNPQNTPSPYYYSALGLSFEAQVAPPFGIRVGGEMYPGSFNQWLTLPDGTKTSFSGYAGDLDVSLASISSVASQLRPYIAWGNRVGRISPAPALKQAAYTAFSSSLVFGAKISGGWDAEIRYPFYRSDGSTPAYFETTVGYWRGI